MEFTAPGNIILVHKGALGDFVLSWPCMLSIRTAFARARIYWVGQNDLLLWLKPLKIIRLPYSLEKEVCRLYHVPEWPRALANCMIFWFGIDRVTTCCQDKRLIFLTGVDGSARTDFRTACSRQLGSHGIKPVNNWRKAWNDYFGPRKHPEYISIFPGSGNRKKNWPLEKYLTLASKLQKQGLKVTFVMGPAEQERGMNISGFETITCHNYEHLQDLIKRALLVIGNDCGPMHLAGMFNVPGIALFGPTPPAIWKPNGIDIISSPRSCCPCSETSVINCSDPLCMDEIGVDRVMNLIQKKITNIVIDNQKNRLQSA